MFVSSKLIYIQLQKTVCTHIANLVDKILAGEIIGKHNSAEPDQIKSNRQFISSIRNPWDWYLSLWTFGVNGKGAIQQRLTKRDYFKALKNSLKHPKYNFLSIFQEAKKDISTWRHLYHENSNVKLFRKWLKKIHDPCNAIYLGEGYNRSAIVEDCGLLTYRYLHLCCTEQKRLYDKKLLQNYADLIKYEKNFCYIDYFIRQERLEEDLIEILNRISPISREDVEFIKRGKKTNASQRPLSITDYYDDETIALIKDRDKLIIDKFNYTPPGNLKSYAPFHCFRDD